ncbi:MAG: helix-turn-helix domain-containing protein [Umezawaea sp.]
MGSEPPGRPRSAVVHQAILEAARDLLVESGYAGLSIDRVAARAGVGKQTVYRRWASKAPLVAEAVLDAHGSAAPPETGDLDRDLRAWLHGQSTSQATPRNAALVRALAAAAAADLRDADELYRQLTGPSRDELVERLRAGVGANQVRADADLAAAADALLGALLYQTLAGDPAAYSPQRVDGLLDIILAGLRP